MSVLVADNLLTQETNMSKHSLSFRSSRIVYYGPHPCENCGVLIVKMSPESGGNAFTAPEGPIYPNTEWHVHVCDPADVYVRKGTEARDFIRRVNGHAYAVRTSLGWVVISIAPGSLPGIRSIVISANQTYATTVWGAWSSALERHTNDWPTWTLPPHQEILEESH